jgi:hypothetical protein
MKSNRIILYTFILIVHLLFSRSLLILSQTDTDSTLFTSFLLNEKIKIFTDRSIYAAGEKIFFRAYNLGNQALIESCWSKILYVEIVDAGNNSLANGKFPLDQRGSCGYITIPLTLRTGNYYIRAYTKWMRNYSPYGYSYSIITIINPHIEEIYDIINPAGKDTAPVFNNNGINVTRNILKCSTGQKKYEKRTKVVLNIEIPDKKWISPEGYCISVIKSGAINSNIYGLDLSSLGEYETPSEIKFYPEIKGISVSGSIVKKNLNIPSAYSEVHLSALGDHPDYFGYLTQAQGRFIFALPELYGTRNFFIGTITKDEDPVEILIDKDFSTEIINLPEIPFMLSGEEKNIAREIMFNLQLEKAYGQSRDLTDDSSISDTKYPYFYGYPTITINTGDYIKLPTLEEFFRELIPSASIIKRKDISNFVMEGNHSDISFYRPLILLDFVPVFNVNNLLKIPPEYIRRIEVINATYIRGNMCFGGIISIFSQKGDIAGMDLPENSFFFDFKTYEPQDEINFPDYSALPVNERIPDFRNTMYWNPVVQGSPGEIISYDFFTSDNTGDYIVIIRGISEEGTILEGHCNFTVE